MWNGWHISLVLPFLPAHSSHPRFPSCPIAFISCCSDININQTCGNQLSSSAHTSTPKPCVSAIKWLCYLLWMAPAVNTTEQSDLKIDWRFLTDNTVLTDCVTVLQRRKTCFRRKIIQNILGTCLKFVCLPIIK